MPEATSSCAGTISKLLVQRPPAGSLKCQLQRQARLRALGVKNSLILDNNKLEQIWYILRQCAGLSNPSMAEDTLNYDEFCQAASTCQDVYGPGMDQYFEPSVFLRLARDGNGAVSLLSLFNYIMRRNAMLQTRVHLSCFDEAGSGYLTEEQLQSYITQLVPELPGLANLRLHFADPGVYSTIATRKFWLLHGRNGRMHVRDLLPGAALAELLEMWLPAEASGEASGDPLGPPSNWFSLAAAVKLRAQFQAIDTDGNGFLSKREFAGFSSGTMSPLFIERIFEEHSAAKRSGSLPGSGFRAAPGEAPPAGEMSFTAFVDFLLAWDHRSLPVGVHYFFPVLDLCGCGRLTQVELYAFLKEVYKMWVACGQYPELSIEDVKDEIFDIVQPAQPTHITATDLIASGMAGTIISILADVNLFWEYDNRESLLQAEEAEAVAATH